MKQIIVQLYPAIGIIIMLLIQMKLPAKQPRNFKRNGSKTGLQDFG